MTKKLNQIETELHAIAENANAKFVEYKSQLDQAHARVSNANEALLEANKYENIEDFVKAKDELKTAQSVVEFLSARVQEESTRPAIDKQQYIEFSNAIKDEANSVNDKVKRRLIEIFDELESLKEELQPSNSKADELLRFLQTKLYKETFQSSAKRARESKQPLDYKDNKIDDWETFHTINNILNTANVTHFRNKK